MELAQTEGKRFIVSFRQAYMNFFSELAIVAPISIK